MKDTLRELLQQGQFEQIAEMATRKKRALGVLVSLTFDPQPQIAWRAVEAMGMAAARVADDNPQYVRNHLRRLHWLLSEESGGLCWMAPQCMAEIVRRCPGPFDDYVPIIVSLIQTMAEEDLEHFRPGILWAIGRLGPVAKQHVPAVLSAITAALDDPDPQVRGTAAWCLAQVDHAQLLADRPHLRTDAAPVDFYEDGHLERTTVSRIVSG